MINQISILTTIHSCSLYCLSISVNQDSTVKLYSCKLKKNSISSYFLPSVLNRTDVQYTLKGMTANFVTYAEGDVN